MYSAVSTAIIRGLKSTPVCVEADISDGLPIFEMVGFLSSEVKEAKERVRTALKSCGYPLPAKRITINLFPADVRKSGAGFDLPIAAAVLAALGLIPKESLKDTLVVGEIGLNGRIQQVCGILPIVAWAKEAGMKRCIIPKQNLKEASLIPDIELWAAESIKELAAALNTGKNPFSAPIYIEETASENEPDFADINGQETLKRACEVAVAGMHNFLMIGPPGSGKTMLAKRIAGILPKMSEKEQLEVSEIYSICGLLPQGSGLIKTRPFRSPHHTISEAGLAGGGTIPRAGEITLAHKGVLFLDELPEFKKTTLEILRQPMEDGQISLVRQSGTYCYPADFMLAAAMNPCKCGYYPDRNLCNCNPSEVARYLGKISQPLLDRIDICVDAPRIQYDDLIVKKQNETSETVRMRITEAQERQKRRFAGTKIQCNSRIPAGEIERYCKISMKQKRFLKEIYQNLQLSARGYHKILKTARTIADLDNSPDILQCHLNEAICYRTLEKRYWE